MNLIKNDAGAKGEKGDKGDAGVAGANAQNPNFSVSAMSASTPSASVSLMIDAHGTGKVSETEIEKYVKENFDFTPRGIIERLDLLRPIYFETAAYGHFGREGFEWEKVI